MAGSRRLTTFYAALGVIALAGGAVIWMSARGGEAGPEALPASASDTALHPGYTLGRDDAPVVVDDYSDFQCPACAQLAVLTLPDVKTRLVETGMVKWRFHDRPLPGHTRSPAAHHAAACADEQDRFWQMHDQLYFQQSTWARDANHERRFRDYARAIGLDMGRYDDCMRSNRYRQRIGNSVEAAATAGINSTPTLFINGRRYEPRVLAFDSLKAAIERAAAEGR
jgi:protein-disulfide isomerase